MAAAALCETSCGTWPAWTNFDCTLTFEASKGRTMSKQFLDRVYEGRSPEESRKLYDEWSPTYDDDMDEHGYTTPARCAAALVGIADSFEEPVLDFGCGTGRSGVHLVESGFRHVDGCDISEAMIKVARNRQIYRQLTVIEPDGSLPFEKGEYQHIAAVGVISVGAASISMMDRLIDMLDDRGTLTFSFNDHTMQNAEYTARVSEFVDTSTVDLLFKERGDHLPGIGLQSTVFVMRKR